MNPKSGILLVILCCAIIFGCTTPDRNKVFVHGEISHLGNTALLISYYTEMNTIAYDTVYSSKSGKLDFKIDVYDEITPITIYFSDKKCWTTLFARPGDHVSIKGNIEYVDMLTISGGIVNDELSQFKKQIRKLYMDRLEILGGKFATQEESEEHLAEINLLLKRSAKEYIKNNPNSIASVILIQDFFYQEYDPGTSDLIDLLQGDAKNFHLTRRLREGIMGW